MRLISCSADLLIGCSAVSDQFPRTMYKCVYIYIYVKIDMQILKTDEHGTTLILECAYPEGNGTVDKTCLSTRQTCGSGSSHAAAAMASRSSLTAGSLVRRHNVGQPSYQKDWAFGSAFLLSWQVCMQSLGSLTALPASSTLLSQGK